MRYNNWLLSTACGFNIQTFRFSFKGPSDSLTFFKNCRQKLCSPELKLLAHVYVAIARVVESGTEWWLRCHDYWAAAEFWSAVKGGGRKQLKLQLHYKLLACCPLVVVFSSTSNKSTIAAATTSYKGQFEKKTQLLSLEQSIQMWAIIFSFWISSMKVDWWLVTAVYCVTFRGHFHEKLGVLVLATFRQVSVF